MASEQAAWIAALPALVVIGVAAVVVFVPLAALVVVPDPAAVVFVDEAAVLWFEVPPHAPTVSATPTAINVVRTFTIWLLVDWIDLVGPIRAAMALATAVYMAFTTSVGLVVLMRTSWRRKTSDLLST